MCLRIGEVIEASTMEFTAQSYELHQSPAFGALVRVGDGMQGIYGFTFETRTSGIEPGRRPIARGQDEVDEEAIYRNNPQLSRLLRTEFRTLTVGYREVGVLHYGLPPHPPRVHSFVYLCPPQEVMEFTEMLDFLSLIAGARLDVPVDELLAAVVRGAARARGNDRAYLVRAGKEIARLMGSEGSRMNAILRRIRA